MSDNQMTAEQAKKNLKDAEGKPQKAKVVRRVVFLQNFLLLLVLLP